MPAKSESQRRLFGMALAYKKGECKDCPEHIKKLADSMSEEELKKWASKPNGEDLSYKIKESIAACIEEMTNEELNDLFEEKKEKDDIGKDLKVPPRVDKAPLLPSGYLGSNSNREPLIPDLFKVPMRKQQKHERRLMDFDEFMKRINYRTHDDTLQDGRGSNLKGK